jgi:hypothetical protein
MDSRCFIGWRHSLLGRSLPAGELTFPRRPATGLQGTPPVFGDQTPSGFPRSALLRCEWGGCSLCAGVFGVPVRVHMGSHTLFNGTRSIVSLTQSLPSSLLTAPACFMTTPDQEFTCVHPSTLPLARCAREQALLGHLLPCSRRPVTMTPVGWGTGLDTSRGAFWAPLKLERPRVAPIVAKAEGAMARTPACARWRNGAGNAGRIRKQRR